MHRALGVIARATRSFRPASVQQPPKLMLSVSMNDQDNAEDQQRNDDEAQNDRKDMYIRAALVGFVLMVGQKMDDTLAHMFSWGSSMKVA